MINCKKLSLSLSFLALASSLSFPAYSAGKEVGKVIGVSGTAYAVSGHEKRPLSRKSSIYAGEVIHTGQGSALQLRFMDDALMSLKENTEFKVVNYNYDSFTPEKNTSALSLVQGGFWTVTGQIADVSKDAYSVNTNFTTIGVRGTYYGAAVVNGKNAHGHKHKHHKHKKHKHHQNHANADDSNYEMGYSSGEAFTPDNQQMTSSAELYKEYFAVSSGAIDLTNLLSNNMISMSPGNNQYIMVEGPNGPFVSLPSMPAVLSDSVFNPPDSDNSTMQPNFMQPTANNNLSLSENKITSFLALHDQVLIQNTSGDLINPPGFANTDSNFGSAGNSTVLLTTAEIASLTNFGAVAMVSPGRGAFAGLASSGGAGAPLIINSNSVGSVTRAASKANALASAVSGCAGPFCTTNINGQTVVYGAWMSTGTFNPLLRDGPNSVNLGSDVLWASGSNPTTAMNFDTLRVGAVSRVVSTNGTPGFMISNETTSGNISFTINFGDPTAVIPVSFNFGAGSPSPFSWAGTFSGRFSDGKITSNTFVTQGQVVNTSPPFREAITSGSLDIGFLGPDATAVVGAIDLVSPTRHLDVVFGGAAN